MLGLQPVTRRWLALVLKIAISVGLITLLLTQAGLSHLLHILGDANRVWLGAGLFFGAVAACLQANQWRGLLSAFDLRRTYWRCLRLDWAARMFDAALPTNIGGDVVRVSLVSDDKSEMAPAALAVVLRRVMSLPGLMLLIAVGVVSTWTLPYSGRARVISLLCLAGGAVLLVLLFGASRLKHHRLPKIVDKMRRALIEARERSAADDHHPFARATFRGLLFWIFVVLNQACFIHGVGIHSPIAYDIAVITCVNALSFLPISLGGYGLREGAFSALLGVGGLGTLAQGTAVGVCLSAQTLLFGLIGAVTYLTLGRSKPTIDDRLEVVVPPNGSKLAPHTAT